MALPSIPVDVLREILEHVEKHDLATLCRVNKIFCFCSQDVLYREIDDFHDEDASVIQTLAQSIDLARRVRSFRTIRSPPELAIALRNMSSLRGLDIAGTDDASILDGCTFKLDSFETNFPNSESFQKILYTQPGLTKFAIHGDYEPLPPFDERCLPNLIYVKANPSWLGILIPGRPVREVNVHAFSSIDLSFFALSTTSIQKLRIHFNLLYPKPKSLLVSIFPSLVHLVVNAWDQEWKVRVPSFLSI
jgi:hypothetical protein